jgi:hypothetical protein
MSKISKKKNFNYVWLVIIIFFILYQSVFSQKNRSPNISVNWKADDSCKIPIEVGLISDKKNVLHIFAYMKPKYFKKTTLRELFDCMSKKYNEYVILEITVFSDKTNLTTAIRNQLKRPPHFNPPVDSVDSDCKTPSNAIYPCPTGYFRAVYFRFENEYFEYSPNAKKVKMKKIIINTTTLKSK